MLEGVNIDTAQNVTINYELANLGDRIAAYLIDWLVLGGYLTFVFFLLDNSNHPSFTIIVILALPFFLYDLVCEVLMNGQSIGKRARQIKVLKTDGSAPSFFNYFLRWILRPVDFFYAIGLVVVLVNGKGQRLGDIASGTTVVKVRMRATLWDSLFTLIEDTYLPQFQRPEILRLNDEHIRLVSKVLRHHEVLAYSNTPLLSLTCEKVKAIMKIKAEQMSELGFLYTVVKDYNYFTQGMK